MLPISILVVRKYIIKTQLCYRPLASAFEDKRKMRGQFHQHFSLAFFIPTKQNVTRKNTFVQKNAGEKCWWNRPKVLHRVASAALIYSIFIILLFCYYVHKNVRLVFTKTTIFRLKIHSTCSFAVFSHFFGQRILPGTGFI